MDKIVLKIGGFYILIKFTKIELENIRGRFIHYLIKRYQGFILSKKPKKIDYKVTFIYTRRTRSLTSLTGKHVFVSLFDKISKYSLITFYHISFLQFDILLTHILQELLAENKGFIIHASAVLKGRKIGLFLGKSGAGKSTAVQLLSKAYEPIADDSGIIKQEKGEYMFYQMPLVDKNRQIIKQPKGFPLGWVYFLHKSKFYGIDPLENKEKIIQKLSAQLYSEKEDVKKQIIFLSDFVNKYPNFFKLTFGKDSKRMIELLRNYEAKI